MKLTGSKVALVGSICGAAMVATLIGEARDAQPAGATPEVQAAPARGQGPGRGGFGRGRGGPQNQNADVVDLQQMMAALPDTAPAQPAQAGRRVLVLGKAGGFVHSSIPLAARTIEALGQKTGAWRTDISFDPADVNTANLANYDAVFLASTTGSFLDDPNDQAATTARRTALMDFIKGGKGLGVIHAGTDSYHSAGNGGDPLWPEFNEAVGGYFKWHWFYPTQVHLKVEDVNNPINEPFTSMRGGTRTARDVSYVDEVYTFTMNSWHRDKVHVLTSIDYAKMPEEVKAQEPAEGKRTDGDYVLSYIHKVGEGRVFVELLGHHESIYKDPAMLRHLLAGMQYALGDLKADDTPGGGM